MAAFTRREDFATTLDTLYHCVHRQCFTIRHVALTSDFLLGFHAFLEEQLQLDTNTCVPQSNDTWDDLDYYNSIETTIAINKQRNRQQSNHTQCPTEHTHNIQEVNALEFWNCAIEDDVSTKEILADIIMIFPEITTHTFETLHLSFNFLDDETLQILSNALIYLYDLKELRITNNDLTYLSFATLNNIWNHKYSTLRHTIHTLDLSGNDALIRDHQYGFDAFKTFVDELLIHSRITFLRLAQMSLKSKHIEYLAKWIIDHHDICTLSRLDLSENAFNLPMIRSLCDVLINNSICRLDTLVLKHCTFDYNAADYFGSHLHANYSLYELDLSGIDLEGFVSFANSEHVMNIGCLRLSDLQCRSQPNWYKLKMDDISDALIKIVTNKCLFIHELHLNRGDLNNDEIMDLCAFICDHPWLRTLVLSNNFITNECIKSLSFCVRQTKKEALKQTQTYCNNIVDGTELLLFGEPCGADECDTDAQNNINVRALIEGYLTQFCNASQMIPSKVRQLCVQYFYPKLVMNDAHVDGEKMAQDLWLNFKYKQFPYDLAMMIIEFMFCKPMNGLKSVLLSGNSLHPTFSACFRNTDLLSKDMLHKISLTKSRYKMDINESHSGLLTFGHLEKFVKTMY
eukprot:41587_1